MCTNVQEVTVTIEFISYLFVIGKSHQFCAQNSFVFHVKQQFYVFMLFIFPISQCTPLFMF